MLVILGFNSLYAKDSCERADNSSLEKAIVKWVYDGDTLSVTDLDGNNKRKIRIIGIDTPEVKHHQQKAQKYGGMARETLRVLLKEVNYQVFLEYDQQRYDRYKRTLAHVTLADGVSISEWLLQQGFAKTLIIPPNVKYVNCYKKAERQARQQKLKLWSLSSNQIKSVQDLTAKTKGYVRLKGKVLKIERQKKLLFLTLDSHFKKPLRLKIKNKNLRYFNELDLDKLVSHRVIVSGILKNKKGKRTITLNHSSQLEQLSAQQPSKENSVGSIKWSTEK